MKIRLSNFLQLRLNIIIYQNLGWKIFLGYMGFLSRIYFLINKSEKDTITRSVKKVFRGVKTLKEIESITNDVFYGILYHYCEKIHNAYADIDNLSLFFKECIKADSLNKLDHALRGGKGVLFVTGHYGAVEYIPIFLGLKKYPVSVIARFATKQLKKRSLMQTRGLNLNIINTMENQKPLLCILGELKKNRIVFIECDEIEEWKPSRKNSIRFLGKPIMVDRTIDLIYERTGATLVFGLLHRISLTEYNFIIRTFEEIKLEMDIGRLTSGGTILKQLERYIYYYPQEWYQWRHYEKIEGLIRHGISIERHDSYLTAKPVFDRV